MITRILPGDRIAITDMTPPDRTPRPSLQPGDINNAGNGPELAGLHHHCPVVTGLAERSRLGLPLRSFLVRGRLSPTDDARFLVGPAIHRSELLRVDRPDRNPPRMSGFSLLQAAGCSSWM